VPEIVYHRNDGVTETIDVQPGTSVMRAAVTQGVPGIVGECGGQLICATCHVYVDEAYLSSLPPIGDEEDEMLDTTSSPRDPVRSRLSCQVKLGGNLQRIEVQIPPTQEPW
jgi:ferredoxin, 2Fe-2S